jgi:hypothetical protein
VYVEMDDGTAWEVTKDSKRLSSKEAESGEQGQKKKLINLA